MTDIKLQQSIYIHVHILMRGSSAIYAGLRLLVIYINVSVYKV